MGCCIKFYWPMAWRKLSFSSFLIWYFSRETVPVGLMGQQECTQEKLTLRDSETSSLGTGRTRPRLTRVNAQKLKDRLMGFLLPENCSMEITLKFGLRTFAGIFVFTNHEIFFSILTPRAQGSEFFLWKNLWMGIRFYLYLGEQQLS